MNTRQMTWGGITATVLACVGLGIYFGLAGLSEATDLAGIIGMFVAVAGLGVSVWGVIAARGAQPTGGQSLTGSRIAGLVTQVGTVAGSVRIGGTQSPAGTPASPHKAPAPGPTGVHAPQGGQSISDSEVTGTVNQLEGIGGDLDLDGSP